MEQGTAALIVSLEYIVTTLANELWTHCSLLRYLVQHRRESCHTVKSTADKGFMDAADVRDK